MGGHPLKFPLREKLQGLLIQARKQMVDASLWLSRRAFFVFFWATIHRRVPKSQKGGDGNWKCHLRSPYGAPTALWLWASSNVTYRLHETKCVFHDILYKKKKKRASNQNQNMIPSLVVRTLIERLFLRVGRRRWTPMPNWLPCVCVMITTETRSLFCSHPGLDEHTHTCIPFSSTLSLSLYAFR